MNKYNGNMVRKNNEESGEFEKKLGVKKGCVFRPLLCSIDLYDAIKNVGKGEDCKTRVLANIINRTK